MVDQLLWDRVKSLDTEDLKRRTGIRVAGDGRFELDVMNEVVLIDVESQTIETEHLGEAAVIAILMYLSEAKDMIPTGEWVNPRDLTGGQRFFMGVHEPPIRRIQERFGNSRETFVNICRHLGGAQLEFADAAFAFDFFKRVPIAITLWLEDEEFPARVSFLVDSTANSHLPLDALLDAFTALESLLIDNDSS